MVSGFLTDNRRRSPRVVGPVFAASAKLIRRSVMPTQEIPHYEWERFFDEFSRVHRGWLVTIEMLGLEIGDQVQVRNLPLDGIAIEPNEIGEDQITIIAGAQGDARISHTIDAPDRVWLKQNDEGADE